MTVDHRALKTSVVLCAVRWPIPAGRSWADWPRCVPKWTDLDRAEVELLACPSIRGPAPPARPMNCPERLRPSVFGRLGGTAGPRDRCRSEWPGRRYGVAPRAVLGVVTTARHRPTRSWLPRWPRLSPRRRATVRRRGPARARALATPARRLQSCRPTRLTTRQTAGRQ